GRLLGQVADPAPRPLVHRQRRDLFAPQDDLAGIGLEQTRQHIECSGLAGTVRAEEADHLSAINLDADVIHHHSTAVALDQSAPLKGALSGMSRWNRSSRSVRDIRLCLLRFGHHGGCFAAPSNLLTLSKLSGCKHLEPTPVTARGCLRRRAMLDSGVDGGIEEDLLVRSDYGPGGAQGQ